MSRQGPRKEVPGEIKDMVLALNERFPPAKQQAFSRAIGSRVSELASSNITHYALFGAVIGVIFDAIPGSGFITDDPVEVGAALGAWVGHCKDRKERAERERIKSVIEDSIREALAS